MSKSNWMSKNIFNHICIDKIVKYKQDKIFTGDSCVLAVSAVLEVKKSQLLRSF